MSAEQLENTEEFDVPDYVVPEGDGYRSLEDNNLTLEEIRGPELTEWIENVMAHSD